jgi:rubredoxin
MTASGQPDPDWAKLSRVVYCPQCGQAMQTMRRWQMACAKCGYEWDESSSPSAADRREAFREELPATAAFGCLWVGFLLCAAAIPASVVVYAFRSASDAGNTSLAFLPIAMVALVGASLCYGKRRYIVGLLVQRRFPEYWWYGMKSKPGKTEVIDFFDDDT